MFSAHIIRIFCAKEPKSGFSQKRDSITVLTIISENVIINIGILRNAEKMTKEDFKMKTGLTSVSFRKLSVDEVIDLAKNAKVDGIEWGSDVHVPETDIEGAEAIAKKTRKAGLEVLSYGSYFFLSAGSDFLPYIKAALAMGTRTIRIWGGKKERWELSDEEYQALVEETRAIGKLAEENGVTVALEYHGHSITATAEDAAKFVSDVASPAIKLYWQAIIGRAHEDNLKDIDVVAPYLVNVHVFNYIDGKQELLETGNGPEEWRAYARRVSEIPGDRAFITEFCKGGLAESFLSDAKVLNSIIH